MRLLTITLLCGCGIDPFETPSAYDQQRYLCEDLDLLQDAADACLDMPAEENCTGVISFKGEIQLVPIRVDTTLQRSIVRVAQSKTDGREYLSRVEISGAAPYFHFDTAISSIGTPWPDGPTPDELTFDTPLPKKALDFEDGHGAVQWYIRAGSDTAMLSSKSPDDGSGTITVSDISSERVDLQFVGDIGPAGDTIDACAIVFPQGGVEIVPIP
jgi:hypothetical protein